MDIQGTCANARVYISNNESTAIDPQAIHQIQLICDQEFALNARIRVMPDVHPGKFGPIGLTMTVSDKINPNLIGIDIGCGMTIAQIKAKKTECQKLDSVIRDCVPSGFSSRKKVHRFADEFDFDELRCQRHIQHQKALLSLGTLGSGNHFIEVDKDDDGNLYLVVHSGSRSLGKAVTEYYLNMGQQKFRNLGLDIPYEMTWLDYKLKEDYIHDLTVVQKYASLNRKIIIDEITEGMHWKIIDCYQCIHNYIDTGEDIIASLGAPLLRKGSVSARLNEKVVIPINMKDGIILGRGLGNSEWNFSAPHGSGRIIKRTEVQNSHTVSEFKATMQGIYSSSIGKGTLDEAPFAYRGINDIIDVIGDTVQTDKIIRPVYNFKAGN
ncbi:MAG: RtcB family protein [Clostridia bacterium]|nr:RtcB family protein [Clostridia bacterium]